MLLLLQFSLGKHFTNQSVCDWHGRLPAFLDHIFLKYAFLIDAAFTLEKSTVSLWLREVMQQLENNVHMSVMKCLKYFVAHFSRL